MTDTEPDQQRNAMPNGPRSTPEERGQVAYLAYGRSVDWKANDGDTMPNWTNLRADRQAGWVAAADAIWQLATDGRITL
jgi:hypothetical protein